MSIGKNIKTLREKAGLTQREFAEQIGVSCQAVSMWEIDNRAPRMGAIQRISERFGVSKSSILDDEDLINDYEYINAVKVPVLKQFRAITDLNNEKYILGYEWVPADLLRPGAKYFYLFVSGNEMAPEIRDGDLALICFGDDHYQKHYVAVAVGANSPAVVRRLTVSNKGIRLICENSLYPPQNISGNALNEIRVVGTVLRVIRNLNIL